MSDLTMKLVAQYDVPASAVAMLPQHSDPPLRGRRIAIIGFAESCWPPEDVWADPTIEKWTLNHGHRIDPRWDRLFEFHDKAVIDAETRDHFRDTDQWAALQAETDRPIYMRAEHADILRSVRFDIEGFTRFFGRGCRKLLDRPYAEMAAAYMLGYAIMRLADERHDSAAHDWVRDSQILVYGFELFDGAEYCVAPETKVLTSDLRWVRAEDVQSGDHLVGYDEFAPIGKSYRYWRDAEVLQAKRLLRPCYALKMADGQTLISSAEHRWLTGSGTNYSWRRTDQLQVRGKRSSRICRVTNRWGDPVHSWDAGYLAAAFDGEGSLGGQRDGRSGMMGYLLFAQCDNEMAETVVRGLGIYGFDIAKDMSRAGDCHQYRLRGGLPEVMRFLGQMRPQRLLKKFNPALAGRLTVQECVPVVGIEYLGERPVVGLGTSTGTFVADGYASHNSHQRACFEFYAGYALGLGIRLQVPETSAIFANHGLYEYDTAREAALLNQADRYLRERFEEIKAKFGEASRRNQDAIAEMQTLSGIMQEVEQQRKMVQHLLRGGSFHGD